VIKFSYEELIAKYIKCAEAISNIVYGDKSSVRRSNKAVEKMIKISKIIIILDDSSRRNVNEKILAIDAGNY
jgi:hypothetical protein